MTLESSKPLKVSVNLVLDGEVIKKIRALAEKDDRSFSQYVNKILREHLKEYNLED